MMTTQEVETIAHAAVEIMRERAINAVRYSEAYERATCTLVLDGSMLSPSTRALPGAEAVYQASPELWEAFGWIVEEIEDIEIPDGRTDEAHPGNWALAWEDGCLFAYAPEHDSEGTHCPDCGKPISLQPSGWWTHDGLSGDCWRQSMDSGGGVD